MCGGSNLSTDPKCPKCIYKISKNFRVEKSGEISRNLRFSCALARFSCLHLNQTLIMAGMAGLKHPRCARRQVAPRKVKLRKLLATCIGSCTNHLIQQKSHPEGWLFCWLGWPDLNRRMPESKSGALPLGDIPMLKHGPASDTFGIIA